MLDHVSLILESISTCLISLSLYLSLSRPLDIHHLFNLRTSNFTNTFVNVTMSGLFLSPRKAQQQQKSTTPRSLAVGDLHGDLEKAKQALKMAKIFDENYHWIAGDSMVVKHGDILDRRKEELKLLYFFRKTQARCREIKWEAINFKNWGDWFSIGIQMKNLCKGLEKQINIFNGVPKNYPSGIRARIAALSSRRPISTCFLANNPTILIVDGSVFVHGGLIDEDGVPGM
ncbi:hypothetical protein AMTRI_Chr09g32730 [Amborella trichopoda]